MSSESILQALKSSEEHTSVVRPLPDLESPLIGWVRGRCQIDVYGRSYLLSNPPVDTILTFTMGKSLRACWGLRRNLQSPSCRTKVDCRHKIGKQDPGSIISLHVVDVTAFAMSMTLEGPPALGSLPLNLCL